MIIRSTGSELHLRLVAAIGASGLSNQVYVERMRTFDETPNAVLDAACAAVAEKAARREALRRAFEAGGCSVAEFAEMYGLALTEVSHALVRPEHLA